MAYVLGYFAADGSMTQHKNKSCFIEFTSTDKVILQNIRLVTGSTHIISERPKENPAWKPQYRLQIGSKEWYRDLLQLGFTPRKSLTLSFPGFLAG